MGHLMFMQSINPALTISDEPVLDLFIQRPCQAYSIDIKSNPHHESRLANGESTNLSSTSAMVNPGPDQRAARELI